MKKRLIAATTALLCGGASAQTSNVQVYGIIDAGILAQNKSATADRRLVRMETSGVRQSMLGFKGTEDLGQGLSAFFNLESHFDTDTGALHGTGDNGTPSPGVVMWRRQANVGLAHSQWGSITLGRQYGPGLLAHVGTEPRAMKEQFSNIYAWAYNQLESNAGPGAANSNDDVGIFMKNAVQYRNTIGPVSGGLLYSLGEQAAGKSRNTVLALGLTYTGPVTLSFSHEFMRDQVTAQKIVKHTGAGIAVPYADFKFKANMLRAENAGANGLLTSKVDAIGVGVDWAWSPVNNATLAYYDNKDKRNTANHTKNIVLSNEYSFSKRTLLYAQMASVDAGSGAVGAAGLKTSIVADGSVRPGTRTTLVNLGIHHKF